MFRPPPLQRLIAPAFGLLCLALGMPTSAQLVANPLYSFSGPDGYQPIAGLIQSTDGALYGTTEYGGAYGDGAIFRITLGGTFTTLYSFTDGNDGEFPAAGLMQATDGALYGTTTLGGADNSGVVFKITTDGTPAGTVLTTLYAFTGFSDGYSPAAGLIQGADGAFYGTTTVAGDGGWGTVFRMTTDGTPAGTSLTTLYSFTNGSDGGVVYAGVIQATDGALYGTTFQGGTSAVGTVFRITTSGTFTSLYSFTGGADGASVQAGLIQAGDGALYGTAAYGGTDDVGTVFKITTDGTAAGTSLTTLYSFTDGSDGAYPIAALIQATDGALYGTTTAGGTDTYGAIFEITTGGTFTPLYSFTYGADGAYPDAGLLQTADGGLYGTTVAGGTNGGGVVFQLVPTFTVTPSAGDDGTVSPDTAQTVTQNHGITFTAAPAPGYQVAYWQVDGGIVLTGSQYTACRVSHVTANHTVSVTFQPATYSLTPHASSGGSISPNTVQTVGYNGRATFTATPNAEMRVSLWSVDNVAAQTGGNSFTLSNVNTAHTVSVSFKSATYTVTPSAGAGGSISPSAVQTVGPGGAVTFTATPATGYAVSEWQVDAATVQAGLNSYRLTNVTADHTVNVTFARQRLSVTPTASSGGTIGPNTVQTVSYNGSVAFTATPNSGKQVSLWNVDNVTMQSGGTSFTLSNVTAAHTVSVSFRSQTFTITPSAGAGGTVSPSTPQTVAYGGGPTFVATPAPGYTVGVWQVDGVTVQTGGNSYKLTSVKANHTVTVTFSSD